MVLAQPAPYAGHVAHRIYYQELQRTYSKVARKALWEAIHAANATRRLQEHSE
jgi:hypothetical protein